MKRLAIFLLFSSIAAAENLDALPASPPVKNPRLRPDDMGSFLDPRGGFIYKKHRRGKRHWEEKEYYGRLHLGIDVISLSNNRDVYAIRGGKVVYRGELTPGFGYIVVMKHEDNYFTVYAHLDRGILKLKIGEPIARGEKIGSMGASGNARESPYPYQVHIEVIHATEFTFLGRKTLEALREQSLRRFGVQYTNPFSVQSVLAAVPHSKNVFHYCPEGFMQCTCPGDHHTECHEFDKTIRCPNLPSSN